LGLVLRKSIVFIQVLDFRFTPLAFFLKLRSPYKEVIQPHLPVRLPCYDFTPVTSPALGVPLQKVRVTTLGVTGFHGVTGGVYKARERIHRSMLTCDY
jgi:hypothetical protein